MADDRDSLLREVEEEIRREQMQKLWERYNGLILGGAALIVASVGGYKWLEARNMAAAETDGAAFATAMELAQGKKTDEAIAAFKALATSTSSGYSALARMHVAGAQLKVGSNADALASFEALAKDPSADAMLRDFAVLQVASLKMGEEDYATLKQRLSPLAQESSVYRISANELIGIAAYKAGNYAEARERLEPLLIAAGASPQIQERIKVILAEIASKETAAAPAAPEATAPAAAKPAAETKPEETKPIEQK